MTQSIDKNKEIIENTNPLKVKDREYTTLKFTVEATYTPLLNYNINIDKTELTQLDLGLDVDSNFQLKITKAVLGSEEKQRRLLVTFETEGVLSEPPEVIQGKIDSLKERLKEIFRDICESFALLLQLEYSLPPLILINVKIPTIQIDDKPITVNIEAKLPSVSVSSTIRPPIEPNGLRDVIKNAINLTRLDVKSKELQNQLKRIIKWYYYALDDPNETDKFIHYFMILEVWKLYKAYKDNDKKCIPTQKPGLPHKNCLSKAIKGLCEDVFRKYNVDFNAFYNGRNKVIHEGLQEVASKYLSVASECAKKIIEELRK